MARDMSDEDSIQFSDCFISTFGESGDWLVGSCKKSQRFFTALRVDVSGWELMSLGRVLKNSTLSCSGSILLETQVWQAQAMTQISVWRNRVPGYWLSAALGGDVVGLRPP